MGGWREVKMKKSRQMKAPLSALLINLVWPGLLRSLKLSPVAEKQNNLDIFWYHSSEHLSPPLNLNVRFLLKFLNEPFNLIA